MDRRWIEQWRDAVHADIRRLLREFEARHGFPPGEHEVSGPATAAELAGLTALHGPALPPDLPALHRVVAEVQLPDVHNGYWIHRPPEPGHDPGHPLTLTDGRQVVVFGSDGGGALFALTADSGTPVLRLADGAFVDGRYDADRVSVVAEDLRGFLDTLAVNCAQWG